jgi:NAD(P)-dependent dehydrogenase (short-subunit alcohol dehydrogenase family)
MSETTPVPAGEAIVFGASGGIGRALAEQLAASGRYATVRAGTRRDGAAPQGTVPFRFDLTDEASIAAAAASLAAPPELVIVATGVLHDGARGIAPEKSWRALDPAAMAHVLAINTIGPALVGKHFLPLFPRDRRAAFAALSARVGSIGDNRLGGWHSYRASKAALNMLVANFAIELSRTRPLAIAAALHPGTVDSGLSAPFQGNVPEGRLFTPDVSARHLLAVLDGLTPADSGGLFAWDGQRLPF